MSGNIDHGTVRRNLRETEIFNCEDIKVLLTHIGGYPGRWVAGMNPILRQKGIRLAIAGHSHILKIMYDQQLDLLYINPGAAGQQGWHTVRTLVKLVVDGGNMRDCEVIELSNRKIQQC